MGEDEGGYWRHCNDMFSFMGLCAVGAVGGDKLEKESAADWCLRLAKAGTSSSTGSLTSEMDKSTPADERALELSTPTNKWPGRTMNPSRC